MAKVRHGQLHLTLNVPDNDLLLDWANTADKLLAGHITFFDTGRRTARETVSFTAGQCVSYQENFTAGDDGEGAYVCQLIIATAEKLELTPSEPAGAFVAPAAREHAAPVLATTVASGPLAENVSVLAKATNLPANPMQPARMELWMGYLERRGVQFHIGTPEAELKLFDNQAEGMYSAGGGTKTIYLYDPPGTATFFEEAFHALQHLRKHPAIKVLESGQEVDAWEYDAKQALLKHSEKLGLSYEEYVETENQLQQVIDNEYGNYNF
ncbi:hypothetical protein HHL22_07800 [Hymenobacter sp. RP-2-7]|uniref:Uncharacterized protein n=1 Tax=Hymenobacter polaris TaxID=2682546 RepID=A0A7Y0AD11_9BACT|nr:type VI secretion system tube protein TssD [Hymenobacter polaris]NML65108.1 hypothetical protein [Hymenobacter polaris]